MLEYSLSERGSAKEFALVNMAFSAIIAAYLAGYRSGPLGYALLLVAMPFLLLVWKLRTKLAGSEHLALLSVFNFSIAAALLWIAG